MNNMKDRMMGRAQLLVQQSDLRRTRQRVAEQQSSEHDGKCWIAMADIAIDPRIQVRVGGLDQGVVHRYATIMAEHGSYAPFPPVEVYRDGDALWLSSGFHRCAAVELADQMLAEAGLPIIGGVEAYVRPGGWPAAYWNAITDNLKHGKQLTVADLKNALYRLAGYDEPLPEEGEAAEYARMSNRHLASLLGVSHTTIRKWLEEFRRQAASGGNQFPPDTRRIGKDGKIYNVATTAEANRRRADQIEPVPVPASDNDYQMTDAAQDNSWLDQRAVREAVERAEEPGREGGHAPDQEEALPLLAELNKLTLDAIAAIEGLLGIQEIWSLHVLCSDDTVDLEDHLSYLGALADPLRRYVEMQVGRLQAMARGRPYPEDGEA